MNLITLVMRGFNTKLARFDMSLYHDEAIEFYNSNNITISNSDGEIELKNNCYFSSEVDYTSNQNDFYVNGDKCTLEEIEITMSFK